MTYYFCGDGCKRRFDADPETYPRPVARRRSIRLRTTTSLAALIALVLVPAAGAPVGEGRRPSRLSGLDVCRGLEHPTAMAWGPDDRLYVTEDTGGSSSRGAGRRSRSWSRRACDRRWALRGWTRRLFVSEQGRLTRFTLQGSSLAGRRAVVRGLPFGRHQQDNVVLGADGRLYLGSGSTCDVCSEQVAEARPCSR